MTKRIYSLIAILCCVAVLASCGNDSDPKPASGDENLVRLTVRAVTDETRTEYDPALQQAIWKAGDQIYVAPYDVDGPIQFYYYEFDLVTPFEPTNASFKGDLWTMGTVDLFFIYGGKNLVPNNPVVFTMPATQRPTLTSFDGEAAIMFGKPEEAITLSSMFGNEATVQFKHGAGFLKLSPVGLPENLLDKTVQGVNIKGGENDILSGTFNVQVTNTAEVKDYSLTPVSSSNTLSLDYSGQGLTLGDLADIWITMLPGEYSSLEFEIVLDIGKVVFAPRSGLVITAGQTVDQQLTFREEDKTITLEKRTLVISGAEDIGPKLGAQGVYYNGTVTVTDSGGAEVTINYYQLASWFPPEYLFPGMSKDQGSYIRNDTPLNGDIISVKVQALYTYNNYYMAFKQEGASWPATGATASALTHTFYPSDATSRHFMMFMRPTASNNQSVVNITIEYMFENDGSGS